jgi:hypothetical protein
MKRRSFLVSIATLLVLSVAGFSQPVLPVLTSQAPTTKKTPTSSHFKAQYISNDGVLITIYEDCTGKTNAQCALDFAKKYLMMTKSIKVDKKATKEWLESCDKHEQH